MNIYRELDYLVLNNYIIARYYVKSSVSLEDAAWNIAIGQSIGNPSVRNTWETEEMIEKHACKILPIDDPSAMEGHITIGFPAANIDIETDGVNHLICQLMGGHTDIDTILACRLVQLDFSPRLATQFKGPKYGISGMRKYVNQYNKPLMGGIIKPKVGINVSQLTDMVQQLVDGGVDFIKEDEIMSNPACCRLEERVDAIANLREKLGRNFVFCHTINCDPHILSDRVRRVVEYGGNGVHINVFSSLGAYKAIRDLDLPLFIHYQSSGAKVMCDQSHRFSISWPVMCKLATMCGVDTIQAGMIGGYGNYDNKEIRECIRVLREGNTLPALSCGLHAGLIHYITTEVGEDYLANAGGAIHGHPGGTMAGAKAIRQAIDKSYDDEYYVAIDKWGIK